VPGSRPPGKELEAMLAVLTTIFRENLKTQKRDLLKAQIQKTAVPEPVKQP